MIKHKIIIRPRYAETDQMGMVYYSRYAEYFEVARTECIRSLGIAYSELEKKHNILLPVRELYIKYHKPAFYDDELNIITYIKKFPTVRIRFDYEVYNHKNEFLTEGYTELVFVDGHSRKPIKPPKFFIDIIKDNWITT